MRILGVDYGERRIGLAITDAEGAVAFPVGALECRGAERDLIALRGLAAEREVARIVVGLPIHMNGRAGREVAEVRAFAGRLAATTGLPVDLLDERWTSVEAERVLRASGRPAGARRAARRRGDVDAVAATLLLQTYVERRHAGAEPSL